MCDTYGIVVKLKNLTIKIQAFKATLRIMKCYEAVLFHPLLISYYGLRTKAEPSLLLT